MIKFLGFIEQKDEIISKKLKVLKSKQPEVFESLKILTKSAKGFEKTLLPKGINYNSIITLEKYGFIISQNFNEYSLLNNRIKNIVDKI